MPCASDVVQENEVLARLDVSGGSLIRINEDGEDWRQAGDMAEQPLINASEARCISLAEETRFEPNGIVSRTLLRTPGVRAVLFGFAEGQELTEHSAPYQALVQALEGECDFTVNGQVHRLKSGDWLSMPLQAPHALKALTRFSMLLILIPPAVSALGRS